VNGKDDTAMGIQLQRAFLRVCLIAVLGSLGACNGEGNGDEEENVAGIKFGLKIPPPAGAEGLWDYDYDVIWHGNLLQALPNTSGNEDPFDITRSYDSASQGQGNGQNAVFKAELVGDLRPGKWRLSASTVAWTAECERDLAAGTNSFNFTINEVSCGGGVQFP
jgi:hypothetical protein